MSALGRGGATASRKISPNGTLLPPAVTSGCLLCPVRLGKPRQGEMPQQHDIPNPVVCLMMML